ncbi:hypothetical protein NC653_008810 [Populus alba x Populus x berolinensis]|uniref:Uncharacterized protein n=1 Tax=Populus alba x Populus x berolinensis TaxID=444605 RepID=A0AAD6W900_9ROSI|nr:hypothetical protein NC653_008810 [Populus alba x Populus x berolinensis]
MIMGMEFFPASGKFVALSRMLGFGVELLQKFKASNPESSVYQSHRRYPST